MKRVLLPIALCGVVASLGACGSPGLKAGQGRLEVSGRAELTRGARAQTLASGSRLVVRGDRVQILEGSARLVLPGGAELDLRQESVVRVDDSPLLLGGEALATTAGRPLTVELGSAQAAVRSHGAARLSRGLAATAGAYRRDVALRSAGREVDVLALRQATSPALGIVDGPIPLRVDASDAWDRRFLAEAIDIGRQLQSLVAPFDSSLRAGEGHTPGFFRVALPVLEQEPAFDGARLDSKRPPAETLIGAAITVSSHRLSFPERWSATFAFRDQGAEWGLVAVDEQVTSLSGVLDLVNSAFGRSPLVFPNPTTGAAGGQLAFGPGPGGAVGGGEAAAGGTSPGSAAGQASGSGSSGGAAQPPSGPVPPPPSTGTPADQIVQPVLNPVVNQLNQVLQLAPSQSSPTTTTTVLPLPVPTPTLPAPPPAPPPSR